MLYTSEGLTFGLRPNALGLRSGAFYAFHSFCQWSVCVNCKVYYTNPDLLAEVYSARWIAQL